MTTHQTIHDLHPRGREKQAIEAAARIDAMHKLQLIKIVKKMNEYWSEEYVKDYVNEFLMEQL